MSGTRANAFRAVLRFVASVMIVSGILLITDAVLTLTWQEPVSAYLADRQQVKLERALVHPPQRVLRKEPLPGDALGKLLIPAIGVSEYVVEGTDTANLRKGPGHYPATPLPGERGTVAVAGHRTTYGAPFRNLDQLHRGNRIVFELPYGSYVYRVEKTQVVDDSALWITKRVSYDRLVLSACHPLYSAAQRIVAFARLESKRPAKVRKAQASWRSTPAPFTLEPSRDSKNSISTISSATEMANTANQYAILPSTRIGLQA